MQAQRIEAAAANETVTAVFVLRDRDGVGLEKQAKAVSDPASFGYGQYLSFESSVRRFGPKPGAAKAVARYLKARGLDPRIDASGLYVEARLTSYEAESLIGTPLARFRRNGAGASFLAPEGAVVVPKALAPYVEAVGGLDQTPLSTRPVRSLATEGVKMSAADGSYDSSLPLSGTPSGCEAGLSAGGFVPNQWLTAYGLEQLHGKGLTGSGERIAVIEIDGFFSQDLATFAECFGFPVPALAVHTVPEKKPPYPDAHMTETILDLSVIAAAAPGLDGIEIYDAMDKSGAGLAKTVLAALHAPKAERPTVISISLGGCEAWNYPFETRLMEKALKHAATAGVSVLVSSGDTGVAACRINGSLTVGGQTVDFTQAAWVPSVSYPASSPWVTATGGTNLALNTDNSIVEEIVWNDGLVVAEVGGGLQSFGSGTGGVSTFFKKPAWQQTSNPISGVNGRLVPDVALLADMLPGYALCCDKDEFGTIGGTSAAAPLMAAATAVMNQALRKAKRPRLGFMNPLIYRVGGKSKLYSAAFNDVTTGNNDVGGRIFVGEGDFGMWYAGSGFDQASGWGSPKFPGFLDAVMTMNR